MKILICGSSGFIGTQLVQLLAAKGHYLVGLDLVAPLTHSGLSEYYQSDIRNREDTLRAMRGIECVVNLAAKHHDFGITRREYLETNKRGSRRLLESIDQVGIRKYLFTSSVAVYGNGQQQVDETAELQPSSPYGVSKLGAEKVTKKWAEADSTRSAVIIRPTVVFGEGNLANMFNLIRMIDKGWYFQFGSGEVLKSLSYVKNLVGALLFCLEHMTAGCRTFNYVDKDDLTVRQTVGIIANELQRKTPSRTFPLWLGTGLGGLFDAAGFCLGRNLRISASRVKRLATPSHFAAQAIRDCGFVARYSLDEGLRNMVRWYLQEIKTTNKNLPSPAISETLTEYQIELSARKIQSYHRADKYLEKMPSGPFSQKVK